VVSRRARSRRERSAEAQPLKCERARGDHREPSRKDELPNAQNCTRIGWRRALPDLPGLDLTDVLGLPGCSLRERRHRANRPRNHRR
jgi:hypothetical protein